MTEALTPLQLSLLQVLWERDEATVNEVTNALRETKELALTTVATLLNRLEKRGLVERRKEGRQFVYRATRGREETRERMVDELADQLFAGDALGLVQHLLKRDDVRPGDLARVKRLIAERESTEGESR